MLNVFIEHINDEIKDQIKIARRHRLKDIKLVCDENIRRTPSICNFKDVITLKGSTSGVNSYCWNVETSAVICIQNSFVLLTKLIDSNKLNCVILDSNTYPKDRKSFFLDAIHCDNLPNQFYNLPVFHTYADIINYGVEKGFVKSFCLEDKNSFQKTTIAPVQGQIVYKNLKTGYYWYLDNFHKDHYEVFDQTGKNHLGEADMNGNLFPNSADKNKHITL